MKHNLPQAMDYPRSFTYIWLLFFGVLSSNSIRAQYILNGPTSALTGETHTYTLSGSNIATINFTADNGATISGLQYIGSGYTVNCKFNNSGKTLISCQIGDEFNNFYNLKRAVVACNSLSAGTITGTQTICGSDPAILGSAAPATGGNNIYEYLWQYSDNNSSWAFISGATAATYDPPSGLTADRWYRRRAQSCSEIKYTGSVKVTIAAPLSAGTISPTPTSCYGGNPGVLGVATPPSGGNGSYAYQWQSSSDGSSGWANVSGATGATYDPPSGATSSLWYRKKVTSCTQIQYTPGVWVKIFGNLVKGTINGTQNVCYGGNPSTLGNISLPTGGNNSYSYLWQYSSNGSSGWTDIIGASVSTYDPPAGLVADRWYRRREQSCSQTVYSENIKVTVWPNLLGGTISGVQTICYGGDPTALGNASSPSGGNGTYTYKWQYSPTGTSEWTYISGATNATYDPPANLIVDRWYRREVQSCSQTVYSGGIRVTVRPDLYAGSVSGSGQTYCNEGNPGNMANAASANGGDGNFLYQWQYSGNGSSGWTDVIGATATDYDPPAGLLVSRWYRRAVTSCNQIKYTASIQVTIEPATTWYTDQDSDGFGDPAFSVVSCTQPVGHVSNSSDLCPFEYGPTTGCDYLPVTLSDENYVYSRTYQHPKSGAAQIDRNSDVLETLVYYDGLGRPMQQLSIKASPLAKDIITHIGYDGYGRAEKEWLPYEATSGSSGTYRPGALSQTDTHYQTHYGGDLGPTPNPFSQKEFEPSPLNRILKQAAPGGDWIMGGNNEIEFAYNTNTLVSSDSSKDNVRLLNVTTSFTNNVYEPTLVDGNGTVYYNAGELHKSIVKDENHDGTASKLHTVEEFTDKQGRVVLKRAYAVVDGVEEAHDTYYVYDDYGNLAYVIPPKVDTSNGVSTTELSELCYQYAYDGRNRLTKKKVPGKGWEQIVYDRMDRPIMTQDAVMAPSDKWLFTRYDVHGRVAFTGMVTGGTRQAEQAAADIATVQWTEQSGTATTVDAISLYYDTNGYPLLGSVTELHSVNYYDGYNAARDGITKPSGQVLGQDQATDVKGLPTATKVRVLGTGQWISSLKVYDKKGRPIWERTNNPYLSTTDIVETELDFAGKALRQRSEHTKAGNAPIVTTDDLEYDHSGRPAMHQQTLAGQTEMLYMNTYDALGQLTNKHVGNSLVRPLQKVDYAYNIRGWLTNINDVTEVVPSKLFNFKLGYNTGADPLYNGNISGSQWRTANTDSSLKSYDYTYDALNRIIQASSDDGRFDLGTDAQPVTYDKNGNIQRLVRKGHVVAEPIYPTPSHYGTMDDLTYTYDNGNKLLGVTDAIITPALMKGEFRDGNKVGNDYGYDFNGNMVSDANKNIVEIGYNHLNLPTNITIGGSSPGTITYIYDATGTKLRKQVSTGTITDYADNYVYEDTGLGPILQFFGHPEGYVSAENGSYKYVYQYKDHLGNIRLSYSDEDGDGDITVSSDPLETEIVEENNYYPFGLEHKGYNNVVNGTEYSYKTYNGKEFDESFGLNWHDYGERNYDASLGRFMNMDLYAHNYMKYSPYSYVLNNPISNVDYKGKFVLPKEFLIKYERLAQYLANDVQGVLENKKITNALKKFGGFNDDQLKEAFTWGQGPVVKIDQLDNLKSFGVSIGTSITIDVDLVDALEKARGKDRDYLLFLTVVTLLHEFVHYGDVVNGVTDADDVTTEQGNEFEIEVYGRVIKLGDAKELLDKYLDEQKKQEEESQKKEESFNNLINNFDSLENGKYNWNGKDFVKTD